MEVAMDESDRALRIKARTEGFVIGYCAGILTVIVGMTLWAH
jgi:hypothetical protein